MNDRRRGLGIVRMGCHVGYGVRHGWLMWAPSWVKGAVVSAWNWVACFLYGHADLVQDDRDGPVECTACCRAVPDSGSDSVIRVWRDIEEWKDD